VIINHLNGKAKYQYARKHENQNGTAHFAHFYQNPIECSSEKAINKIPKEKKNRRKQQWVSNFFKFIK
jgi:hypothetical protein